jgi:hypothetical protein
MTSDRGQSLTRTDDEPTLPNLLRSFALGHVPTRFYQLLQFALPLSAQAWLLGFPRVAGWLLVLSALGIWALAAQRMERDSLAVDVYAVETHPSKIARIARRLAGFTAGAVAGGLAVEAFVNLLSVVFKCPGCAG